MDTASEFAALGPLIYAVAVAGIAALGLRYFWRRG